MAKSQENRVGGFTLIETLSAVALILLLAASAELIALRQISTASLDRERTELLSLLYAARERSLLNEGRGSHGVFITDSSYIFFEGDHFDSDDPQNTVFPHERIGISGDREIMFDALSAESAARTITLSAGPASTTVFINAEGGISYAP